MVMYQYGIFVRRYLDETNGCLKTEQKQKKKKQGEQKHEKMLETELLSDEDCAWTRTLDITLNSS